MEEVAAAVGEVDMEDIDNDIVQRERRLYLN